MINKKHIEELRQSNSKMCKPHKSDYELLKDNQFTALLRMILTVIGATQCVHITIGDNAHVWFPIIILIINVAVFIWSYRQYIKNDNCRVFLMEVRGLPYEDNENAEQDAAPNP